MPHIPLYVPDDVRDSDPKNAYVNTIEHIDSEVGRLLNCLDELGLSERTYVIYTTDNGPWLRIQLNEQPLVLSRSVDFRRSPAGPQWRHPNVADHTLGRVQIRMRKDEDG